MEYRKNESEKVWFRTDRCFSVDGKWFFTTREGEDVGPFGSRQKAIRGVSRYIDSITMKRTSSGFAAKVASDGVWASNAHGLN